MTPNNTKEIRIIRTKYPSKTYSVDKQKKRIISMKHGLDAIIQSVEKILSTERYSHSIYTSEYGVEMEGLIGKSMEYIEAVLEEHIKDALMADDRIKDVKLVSLKKSSIDSIDYVIDIFTEQGKFEVRKSS